MHARAAQPPLPGASAADGRPETEKRTSICPRNNRYTNSNYERMPALVDESDSERTAA